MIGESNPVFDSLEGLEERMHEAMLNGDSGAIVLEAGISPSEFAGRSVARLSKTSGGPLNVLYVGGSQSDFAEAYEDAGGDTGSSIESLGFQSIKKGASVKPDVIIVDDCLYAGAKKIGKDLADLRDSHPFTAFLGVTDVRDRRDGIDFISVFSRDESRVARLLGSLNFEAIKESGIIRSTRVSSPEIAYTNLGQINSTTQLAWHDQLADSIESEWEKTGRKSGVVVVVSNAEVEKAVELLRARGIDAFPSPTKSSAKDWREAGKKLNDPDSSSLMVGTNHGLVHKRGISVDFLVLAHASLSPENTFELNRMVWSSKAKTKGTNPLVVDYFGNIERMSSSGLINKDYVQKMFQYGEVRPRGRRATDEESLITEIEATTDSLIRGPWDPTSGKGFVPMRCPVVRRNEDELVTMMLGRAQMAGLDAVPIAVRTHNNQFNQEWVLDVARLQPNGTWKTDYHGIVHYGSRKRGEYKHFALPTRERITAFRTGQSWGDGRENLGPYSSSWSRRQSDRQRLGQELNKFLESGNADPLISADLIRLSGAPELEISKAMDQYLADAKSYMKAAPFRGAFPDSRDHGMVSEDAGILINSLLDKKPLREALAEIGDQVMKTEKLLDRIASSIDLRSAVHPLHGTMESDLWQQHNTSIVASRILAERAHKSIIDRGGRYQLNLKTEKTMLPVPGDCVFIRTRERFGLSVWTGTRLTNVMFPRECVEYVVGSGARWRIPDPASLKLRKSLDDATGDTYQVTMKSSPWDNDELRLTGIVAPPLDLPHDGHRQDGIDLNASFRQTLRNFDILPGSQGQDDGKPAKRIYTVAEGGGLELLEPARPQTSFRAPEAQSRPSSAGMTAHDLRQMNLKRFSRMKTEALKAERREEVAALGAERTAKRLEIMARTMDSRAQHRARHVGLGNTGASGAAHSAQPQQPMTLEEKIQKKLQSANAFRAELETAQADENTAAGQARQDSAAIVTPLKRMLSNPDDPELSRATVQLSSRRRDTAVR